MKRPSRSRTRPGAAAALAALLFPILPAAPAEGQAPAGGSELALVYDVRLDGAEPGLFVDPEGSEARRRPADVGDLLNAGDDARTNARTRAAIRFTDDQSLIRMSRNTLLRVRAEGERGALTRTLELEGGEIWGRIRGREGTVTEIRTPSGVAAIRGTDFLVQVDPATGATTVITLEGMLEFFNELGRVDLSAYQATRVGGPGERPEARRVEEDELEGFRELLRDAAGDRARDPEWLELVLPGLRGREVRLQVDPAALRYLDRGGSR